MKKGFIKKRKKHNKKNPDAQIPLSGMSVHMTGIKDMVLASRRTTLMGVLIGFFSAGFASVAGWAISEFFFDIEFQPSARVWIYSMVSACLVLTLAGTIVSRRVYNVSPMRLLRS